MVKLNCLKTQQRSIVSNIKDRLDNYVNTFNELYFLIWSFTKRSRLPIQLEIKYTFIMTFFIDLIV